MAGLKTLLGIDPQLPAGRGGAGVRVVIIDFGFHGYSDAVRMGLVPDLPPECLIRLPASGGLRHRSRQTGVDNASSHGVAVLEIMYAIAPAADYYLIEIDGYETCIQALDMASRLDAHVVHNSFLQWTNSWGDGGGPLADAVTRACNQGSLVVLPAGNGGQCMYKATFSETRLADGAFHAWDATDLPLIERPFGAFNRLKKSHRLYGYSCRDRTVNPIGVHFPGAEIKVYLKWSSADSDTCYEAILVQLDLQDLEWRESGLSSHQSRRAGRRPVSALRCRVPDEELGIYGLRLRRVGGAVCAFQLYLDDPGGLGIHTPAESLAVPGDADDPLVVAASRTSAWPLPDVPAYSARGPTKSGRQKPDLAGPSSVYLHSLKTNGGILEGTCTASSVVGAIAVLVWEQTERDPGRDRFTLRRHVEQRLTGTARAAHSLDSTARRNVYGHGLIDAHKCLANLGNRRFGRVT